MAWRDREYKRGPKLDQLREDHPLFIKERLVFGEKKEVILSDLSGAYGKWLGVKNWSSWDVGNLYVLILTEHLKVTVVEKPKTKFHGVGLRRKK